MDDNINLKRDQRIFLQITCECSSPVSVTSTYGLERVCAHYFMFISLLFFYFVCVMFILCLYCVCIVFILRLYYVYVFVNVYGGGRKPAGN